MSDLTTMLRIMGTPRCVQAADEIEALTAERDALREDAESMRAALVNLRALFDGLDDLEIARVHVALIREKIDAALARKDAP